MNTVFRDLRLQHQWLALLLLLLVIIAPSRALAANGREDLYTDPPRGSPAASAAVRNDVAVTRQKPVVLNFGYLQSQIAKGSGQVDLTLVDGSTVTVELNRVEQHGPDRFTWYGRVTGYDDSQVILSVAHGQVAGHIVLTKDAGSIFQIRPGKSGAHWLQQIDQRAFPPDHPAGQDAPRAPSLDTGGQAAPTSSGAAADTGATIDVMIVYSNQTATAAGSGIGAEIQNAVDTANAVYANSGINTRLRLVHDEQVAYDESGDFYTDLNRLTSTRDGYMDNVHALRDQYGADLVSLFVENGQYCGLGWVGPSASYAFTVVNRGCASGNYSYAHETGHNVGALHDPYVDPSTSPYAYGHGYANAAEGWRTVMAYNNQCAAVGTSCTRVAYMSNPLATYPPTGSLLGTPASGTSPTSDVVHVHNQNALTVANFRTAATGGCTYGLSPTSASIAATGATASFGVTTGTDCVWNTTTTATWVTVSSTSPTSGAGTLTYTVAANTGPARGATITVGNQTFTVSQASGCTYQITPGNETFGASGGTGSVSVTSGPGCPWNARSSVSWVNNVSPATASGSAMVDFAVAPNSGSTRAGNLTIGGLTFMVTENTPSQTTPVATLSPVSLSLGTVNVGKTSGAKTATLKNTGGGTLTISTLTMGGTDSGDFLRTGTCAANTGLGAGQSCKIVITFAPTASGARTASLAVSASDGTPVPVLTLSGTGKVR